MRSGGVRLRGILFGPIGVLYVFFLLLPLSFFILLSVFTYSPMEMYESTFTLDNYFRFLGDSYYQAMLLATFRIAFLTTAICLPLGYTLAYFLARYPGKWRGLLLFLVIAPMMSGPIVRTYAWVVILGREGAVNRAFMWLGITDKPVQILYTEGSVIIALVHILLPFMVFPLFAALVNQDPDLEPAAASLGAKTFRKFFEVTLPLSRPGIIMGSVLVFTLAAGAVVTPSLMGGKDVQMLGRTIYEMATTRLNWPLSSALAMILVLCQFVLIFLYTRRERHGTQVG